MNDGVAYAILAGLTGVICFAGNKLQGEYAEEIEAVIRILWVIMIFTGYAIKG